MSIQCQYDLEAHLNHSITFLLHQAKYIKHFYNLCWLFITGAPVRQKNWRDEMSCDCANIDSVK